MHYRRSFNSLAAVCLFILFGLAASSVPVQAQAIRTNDGFNTTSRMPNDNGFDGPIEIGFGINFYGHMTRTVFVNNNGNVTLGAGLREYSPEPLDAVVRRIPQLGAIFAPYWADVDTRGPGSDVVRYGPDTVDGHAAFGFNYINVGYYSAHDNKLNSFQLVLIDRSDDKSPGDFDFELNFNQVQWETGDASGGFDGLGGDSARIGFSAGDIGSTFQIPGGGIPGSYLDTNPDTGVIYWCNIQGNLFGSYVFQVRDGEVLPAGALTQDCVSPE
jgi:hypothetical protein